MNKRFGRKNFEKDAARQRVFNSLAPVAVSTVDHGGLLGLGDDDHSQYVHLSAVRIITARHSFSPASAQAPFDLGVNAQGQLVTGLRADQLNKSVTAGNGLTGGGLLTADITLNVGAGNGLTVAADSIALTTPGTLTVSSTNNAAGSHTHAITASSDVKASPAAALLKSTAGGQLSLSIATLTDLQAENVDSHLVPKFTDTYDLGTSTKLWRKGWLSEMEALLFVENTITLLGGWFWIPKDAGTLPGDITAVQTTIDFGKAVTSGSWVIFRSSLAVEYVLVGTLISGTNYNVTRNVDGSGGNAWAAGQPFAVLGVAGDGRIELNAYNTPRIQLIKQGATYNAQTELIRIGDLNGGWGYSTQTWGVAIGEYASTRPNITIDEDGALRFRIYTTEVMNFSGGNADITGKLRMPGTSSAITIGATPPTGAAAGTGIWIDRTGFYSLSAGVYQVKIDATNGKLYAGGGGVIIDANGIDIKHHVIHDEKGKLKFYESEADTTPVLTIDGDFGAGSSELQAKFTMPSTVARFNEFVFYAAATNDGVLPRASASMILTNVGYLQVNFDGNEALMVSPAYTSFSNEMRVYRNGFEDHVGYIYVPLKQNFKHTSYDGDSIAAGTYSIDTSAFVDLPTGLTSILSELGVTSTAKIKAWHVRLVGKWASAGSSNYAILKGKTPYTNAYSCGIAALVANIDSEVDGNIIADAAGDFSLLVAGANANIHIQLVGYFI